MSEMRVGRWLTENEYRRIRYQAKKMGATEIDLRTIWHSARIGDVIVYFAFRPFMCHAVITQRDWSRGNFSDKAGAEELKLKIDTANEFMEYLKTFNSTLDKTNV